MKSNWFSFSKRRKGAFTEMLDQNEIRTDVREQALRPIDLQSIKMKYDLDQGDRRNAPRFAAKLPVLIFTPQRSFRTVTANISALGVLLQDPLPVHFHDTPVEVLLFPEGQTRATMMFRAAVVDGSSESQRIQFNATNPASLANIEQLLMGYPILN